MPWPPDWWPAEEVERPPRVLHPSGDLWILYTDNLYRRDGQERRPLSWGALRDDMARWEPGRDLRGRAPRER